MLAVLTATDSLGAPLRHEGFSIRPPKAFHMARLDLFHGTKVGSIGGSSYLAAALLDGDGEDAASMLLTVVDAPLDIGLGVRDTLATDVSKELKDELDQKFMLERADVVPNQRVEVRGSIRAGSQARQILVAAFPGEAKHTVAIFSVPTGRWDELRAAIADSLDSYRVESAGGQAPPRRWALGFAALLGATFVVSVGLSRRRRSERTTYRSG